jgi:magnesium chelatase family protein
LGLRSGTDGGPEDLSTGAGTGCFCTPDEIRRYWRKFGAALLDRVELRVAVMPPAAEEMGKAVEESSREIGLRVLRAVEIQRRRFAGSPIRRNARIPAGLMDTYSHLSGEAGKILRTAAEKLGFSGRAFHGILRTARTIADLEGKEEVEAVHVLEAVQHRRLGDDPYDILSTARVSTAR